MKGQKGPALWKGRASAWRGVRGERKTEGIGRNQHLEGWSRRLIPIVLPDVVVVLTDERKRKREASSTADCRRRGKRTARIYRELSAVE